MSEEEKKTILGDLYEKLGKSQQAGHHQAILDHTEKSKSAPKTLIYIVLQVDSGDN
jgi:hypothetical protein